MLTLRIENIDQLLDGGPLSFEADRRGLDVGRDQHLDWTLPDDSRFISGKHCEIRYFDDCYWLYDVSTNGTFVNGSSRRVKSPYKLCDGDKLEIGDYVIAVAIEGEALAAQAHPVEERPDVPAREDLWEGTGISLPPIAPRDLLPPVEQHSRAADFLSSVVDIPTVHEQSRARGTRPPTSGQPQNPKPADPWSTTGVERPVAAHLQPAPKVQIPAPHAPAQPPPVQAPAMPPGQDLGEQNREQGAVYPQHASEPFFATLSETSAPSAPQQSPYHAAVAPPSNHQGSIGSEFIRRFAAGADIPENALQHKDPNVFANELGVLLKIVCDNLSQLLQARAAAKTLARSEQRTLIQHSDNNPLKFMPSPAEAMRAMFAEDSRSYLDAVATMEQTFADLKKHQMATYSAMQLAFEKLMEDLSPESILAENEKAKSRLLASTKSKNWETYETRWEEKSGQFENGMLDAFLTLFAELYNQEIKK